MLEQYRCWGPVCASSAQLIRLYLDTYRATKDPLHLEEAKALASTLIHTQSTAKAPDRYQTWVMQNPRTICFNCELMVVWAMRDLVENGASP